MFPSVGRVFDRGTLDISVGRKNHGGRKTVFPFLFSTRSKRKMDPNRRRDLVQNKRVSLLPALSETE